MKTNNAEGQDARRLCAYEDIMQIRGKRAFPSQPMELVIESIEDKELLRSVLIAALGPASEEKREQIKEVLQLLG